MTHRTSKSPSLPGKAEAIQFWSSIILSILGAADSLYLLILKLTNMNKMCLGNGDCTTVNNSSYSEIFGIPISLIGMLAYLAMLTLLLLESRVEYFKANGRLLIFGMSLAGVIYSAYLTYIEIYKIYAICPFCVASAVIITLIFVISIFRVARQ